ncbi:hypothetical protein CPC08DRAFT_771349 [Agrocybe pediades]|nr:hypothetical protein CPC08DRAFT_771349 [Agrocybe pediades]
MFRYLKGTLDMKLEYGPDPTIGDELFWTEDWEWSSGMEEQAAACCNKVNHGDVLTTG